MHPQGGGGEVEPEKRFHYEPIHPTCRTGIPCPTAATSMWSARIDIGSQYIRIGLVYGDRGGGGGVFDRIDHGAQFPSPACITQSCEGHSCPNCRMGVLPTVLPDTRHVPL